MNEAAANLGHEQATLGVDLRRLALETVSDALSAKLSIDLARPRAAIRHAQAGIAGLTDLLEPLTALAERREKSGVTEDAEVDNVDGDLASLLAIRYPKLVDVPLAPMDDADLDELIEP